MSISLAGTGKRYIDLQARMKNGRLHIQGLDGGHNRDYGVAVDIDVPEAFAKWSAGQPHTLKSAAGTGATYLPIRARIYPGDVVHVQVAGSKLNRNYGSVLNVTCEPLRKFVADELAKPAACGLATLG